MVKSLLQILTRFWFIWPVSTIKRIVGCRWSQSTRSSQRFLSIVSEPVVQGPAIARLINVFGAKLDHAKAIETAHNILTTLDKHLQNRQWLATDHSTIADISNYPYIAHAPEGDVSLQNYPNIRAWLQRVEALPGFIPMQASV